MSALRAGARRHRARPARQVRRLLSRPRRQPAREGRLGRRDVRRPRQPGRAGGAGRADPDRGRSTISRPCASCFAPARRRDRGGHRRAGGRQHGRGAAGAGLSRRACARSRAQHGALLIFDEVITGFRVAYGGAQARYGVRPDLTCLGKIIGGGLPVGAYGGRRELMSEVAPLGRVYQAGTLSGNPLAVAAGLAALRALDDGRRLRAAGSAGRAARAGARARRARKAGVPLTVNRVGSMLTAFFCAGPGDRLRLGAAGRHRALRALLPRDARARRLPRALAVRGGVRLAGAHRGRPRRGRRAAGRGGARRPRS